MKLESSFYLKYTEFIKFGINASLECLFLNAKICSFVDLSGAKYVNLRVTIHFF